MPVLVTLSIILVLSAITFQDLLWRKISWFLLPLLLLLFLYFGTIENASLQDLLQSTFVNISLLVIQFVLVILYFSFRRKKLASIVDTYIGLGDILFLLVISFGFSTVNFIVFYLVSLLITLLFSIPFSGKASMITIPLAGSISALLILVFVFKLINPALSFYNDSLVNSILWKLSGN